MAYAKLLKTWWAHFCLTAILLQILCFIFPDSFSSYYTLTASIILYLFIAKSTYDLLEKRYNDEKIESYNKAVLVTGCDSGFGNLLARRLDSKGFHVFATCLFPDGEGASELKRRCSSRLKVLYMDVTKDESVEKAFAFVKENLGSNELWAVVNNAGLSKAFCSFEFSSLDNFKETIDVNSLGPVRVTKAFLSLLKQSKGRIVNVVSFSGRVALVETCAYTMSKYAALGLTECLSQEMKPFGIRVISIEPEIFRTGLTKDVPGQWRDEVNKVNKDILSEYGNEYLKDLEKFLDRFVSWKCSKLDIVVDDMELAICLKNPCHVYRPRRNLFMRFICYLAETVPFEVYEMAAHICLRILGYPVPKVVKAD